MKLKDLLKNIKIKSTEGDLYKEIKNISSNSKEITADSLFVAILGTKYDGHNFIKEAIKRGAVAVVLENNRDLGDRTTKILVSDTREALGEIWSNLYHRPSFSLKMVGVTGTNGKTTVTYLCQNIFEGAGYKTAVLGTIKNIVRGEMLSGNLTTLDAGQFQKYLHYAMKREVDYAFCEVSSHGLAQKRVQGIKFDVAIFTNLTQDHLDFHKDMEDYFQAKLKLFTEYGKDNFTSLVNIDDEYGKRIVDILLKNKNNFITYAIEQDANIRATNITLKPEGSKFEVIVKGKKNLLQLKLVGRFNIYNSLAALGMGIIYGLNLADIKHSLEKITPIRGRMERVGESTDYYVFIDYAHTPAGLQEILLSSREFSPGRILLVFGCGGDRDKTKRKIMGEIAAKFSSHTIITSDNPRSENPEEIVKEIEDGFVKDKKNNYEIIVDRYSAIKKILNYAQKDDVVLIAGKGHEDYQIFKDKTIHFDDREVVEEILKGARE